MGDIKKREYILGFIMLVTGIGYLILTSQLPRKQFVDAAFIPYVLGFILCVLGVMQLRTAWRLVARANEKRDKRADYPTVWKTVALIVGYTALLAPVGFPIMTVVYLIAQFIVLTPADKKPNYLLYTVIAVLTSACVYLLFRYAFDMMLPVGFLDI